MGEFVCSIRELCNLLINGHNIEDYLKENFNLSPEDMATVVSYIQRNLVSKCNERWRNANRKKERFESKNVNWLDGQFRVPLECRVTVTDPNTSGSSGGRLTKPYEASSEKTKKRKNMKLIQEYGLNESSFQYGLSTLHAWIRSMEMILHISYNLSFEKWSATTPENKKIKEEKKKLVQNRFREEMGLHVDKPRQGTGNSNDGNTARTFFQNYSCSADITGVDVELIKRMYGILQTMSSGMAIDSKKFGEYAYSTAQLYVNNYNWYYMPSSVHKILIPGEKIIEYYAILIIGQLSEDAQECRNKDYKRFRLHHSRKCSRAATNEYVFQTLLYTSDP